MTVILKVDVLPKPKPDLSYFKKPTESSKIRLTLWHWWMWFEATFAFSMLEPWEKILLLTVFASLFCLFMTGIIRYLPHHISVMHSRAVYYLWGQEDQASSLWQWIGKGAAPTASYQEL